MPHRLKVLPFTLPPPERSKPLPSNLERALVLTLVEARGRGGLFRRGRSLAGVVKGL